MRTSNAEFSTTSWAATVSCPSERDLDNQQREAVQRLTNASATIHASLPTCLTLVNTNVARRWQLPVTLFGRANLPTLPKRTIRPFSSHTRDSNFWLHFIPFLFFTLKFLTGNFPYNHIPIILSVQSTLPYKSCHINYVYRLLLVYSIDQNSVFLLRDKSFK